MSKYIDADMLEKDGWNMQRIRQASPTEMIYEVKKPTDFPAVDVVEVVRCKDCERNPKDTWFGCPMAHCSETQRPEMAWCWKWERRKDG